MGVVDRIRSYLLRKLGAREDEDVLVISPTNDNSNS